MNTVAHTIIMRGHSSLRDLATVDVVAERYLIDFGYARYTTKPLMRLTRKAHVYAEREIAWQRGKAVR